MPESSPTIASTLGGVKQQLEAAIHTLESPQIALALQEHLHNPDSLPNAPLTQLSAEVVDTAERLQHLLIPSVSLLADGFFGYLLTKALWTAVDANVPDMLQQHGPLDAHELGSRCNVQPVRLSQVLDMLVKFGLLEYNIVTRQYSNNRASALLTHDHWTQWHRWSDLYGTDFFDASRAMPQAIKAGESLSAAQIEYGTNLSLFEFFSEQGRIEKFHATLGAGALAQGPGLAIDYPWGEIGTETLVDLGAGSGAFLASILRAHPALSGRYFDLQHAVDMARPKFLEVGGEFSDVGDRIVGLEAGDFLTAVPSASVYTMKWCLHDWLDENVIRVFKNIRASMLPGPHSRLIVLEGVKQPGRSSRIPNYGDLVMMITANGKERSVQEWTSLAKIGGWKLHHIYPIRRAWLSAIELRPA
ncbi:unnamed protein product [Penicillium glandicola]